MERLLEYHLADEHLELGVRIAIQLLGSDPLREEVHRTLMQLYARLNRPGDALRQYRQCRRLLFRELDLLPKPATEHLYQEILAARRMQLEAQSPTTILTAPVDADIEGSAPLPSTSQGPQQSAGAEPSA